MKSFLSYVEIRTKITSLFAFLMTLAWLAAMGRKIHWPRTAVFFASMFLFDLTTTAINNYVDTKTNEQTLPFPRPAALLIILALLAASTALGLLLAVMTDVVVLLAGILCFLCGIFYTWGPLPISRLPLGELFSGLFYGLVIPFLLLYINLPGGELLTLHLSPETFSLRVGLRPLFQLLLLSLAPACATANIMLANNLCDLDQDIAVHRHTLPYYLGREKALRLFTALSFIPCAAAVLMVLFGAARWPYLFLLLTAVPIWKNDRIFLEKQEKAATFVCAIKNFVVLMSADVALLFLCRFVSP